MPRYFLLISIILILLTENSWPTIINIPADYPTIQQGIDASNDGDTVLVQPGTYVENIDFNGHNIVLGSLFLTTGDTSYIHQTIIDGDSIGSVVTFHYGEDSTAIITGFTLQKGKELHGGGVKCQNSSPTVINNIIRNNSGQRNGRGGGIYLLNANPMIKNNIIVDNYGGWGGGIYCEESDPSIIGNLICFNEIYQYKMGGGIYLQSSNNPTIIGNTISLNIGVAIHCSQSYVEVRNSIFWYNIQGEISFYTGGVGPYYCDIRGGWGGTGIIDTDPQFIDPGNYNFNVCAQSPCIDAGDPNILDPDSTRSDIGLYFPDHTDCSFGNIWYVSVYGNDTTGNGSINNPFRTIQFAVDLSRSLDTIIVLNGIYDENVDIMTRGVVLASNFIFTQDSLDIVNTIIDGDSSGSALSMYACDTLAAVKGLTIRNGLADEGGGLYCYSTDADISNCIFLNNVAIVYGGGVCAIRSSIKMENCRFTGNIAMVGGGMGGGSSGDGSKIIDCIFENNQAWSEGGAMEAYVDTVRGCKISNNRSLWGGGFAAWFSETEIVNNVFVGNTAELGGGIFLHQSTNRIIGNVIQENKADSSDEYIAGGAGICILDSKPYILNNLITGNNSFTDGGGLLVYGDYPWGGAPRVTNNTFSKNSADVGGAVYSEYSNQIFKNNICWNDSADISPEVHNEWGYPVISYCDIQGGQMNLNPLFRDPDNGDFHLMAITCGDSADSPCIDAGDPGVSDIFLNCDWGLGTSHSDIGAYGGGDSVMSDIHYGRPERPYEISLLQNYPNPFNARTTIRFVLTQSQDVLLTVYDLLGRRVEILIDEYIQAGVQTVNFDASVLSSGVYFYRLEAGDRIETKRMVLLK